jgi:predicted nicotinamide N-methyase
MMAEIVLQHRAFFKGKRVLELGSGVGLTAVVLARDSGASALMVTDFDSPTLGNLTHNLRANGLNIVCDEEDSALIPDAPANSDACPVYVRRLDWTNPPKGLLEAFRPDIIIACDTVYVRFRITLHQLQHNTAPGRIAQKPNFP